ncbi:MAG TPA: class IV adenylate cyclase [Steroidobacteraceae bacterium]|jgi:predicted adenylyl cyclase CyaB|nr:class IV adenylate cyclase [Steroidobacteraceae bacterium]
MARNIEIKARIAGVAALQPLAARLADTGPTVIEQDDTFFACPHGRLKLRDQLGAGAELIFYQRADDSGPKESFYLRVPVPDPNALRELLQRAHGQTGRVRKRRVLFLVGRTRIHLDVVEGLGEFLELEVVLREGESAAAGIVEARSIMAQLGVAPQQLTSGAYVDLLPTVPSVQRCP